MHTSDFENKLLKTITFYGDCNHTRLKEAGFKEVSFKASEHTAVLLVMEFLK